jgi:hypothetical protein
MLAALRETANTQIIIQSAGLGSLDTQAGVAMAGAAGLAAVDLSLKEWVLPLALAGAAALLAITALLVWGPWGGPEPRQVLRGRIFKDEDGNEVLLEDEETEWLLIGDLNLAIRMNDKFARLQKLFITLAGLALLGGIVSLVGLQIGST